MYVSTDSDGIIRSYHSVSHVIKVQARCLTGCNHSPQSPYRAHRPTVPATKAYIVTSLYAQACRYAETLLLISPETLKLADTLNEVPIELHAAKFNIILHYTKLLVNRA